MPDKITSEERFLRLFVQNEDALRAYARALLPDWASVDEVLQESSVVMWRKLDQLRDESEFLPWGKMIVRFEALRSMRSAARDRLCFSADVIELLAGDDASSSIHDHEREQAALKHCLEKLEIGQRELVLLPYRGHGAVVDLAAETRRTVNSLYKKIGRLRERLTQCVNRQMDL
jgi:RNA polymerase sigma-70 factor (ECF subfamily)